MFDVQSVSIEWRGEPVVGDVRFSVSPGEIVVLTGANGAGKSSLIAALAGLDPVARGRVLWQGRDVTDQPFHARQGIALVPEGRLLAPSLTVQDTLRIGAGRTGRHAVVARKTEVLARFPILADRLDQPAGTLSGGEAQMLSLARALMSAPRLLLLDEPTLGLSPAAARSTFATLHALRAEGLGMILTDQDDRAARALADRIFLVADRRVAQIDTPCPQLAQGDPT